MPTQFMRLFPLQSVVLFPGMELPLLVFEPRYLQLARECVESDEPFGVVLLRSGAEAHDPDAQPFDIGTTARIEKVSEPEGGRLRVQAKGEHRFRVHLFTHDLPYLAAEAELLDDAPESGLQAIAERTKENAVNVVRALASRRGGWIRDVPMPNDAIDLSYVIAQMFQGDPRTQQHLLELPTAAERLVREAALLSDVLDQITTAPRRGMGSSGFSPN